MNPRLLADAVLLGHLAFIAFAVAGGFAVLHWPRLAWLHLPALAWAGYVTLTGSICPLTPLEVGLRHAAGQAGYDGGFVEHYLVPLIYPPGLTRPAQAVLGLALVARNVALYAAVVARQRAAAGRAL